MTPFLYRIAALVAFASLCVSPFNGHVAIADEALELELEAMSVESILPIINKRGGGRIAVGGYAAAASVKGSAGPEIQLKLSKILQHLGVEIDSDEYRFEVNGNYLPYNDPDSNLYGVKLVTRVVDAESGTTLGEFPRFVFGPESVPRLLGLNVSSRGSSNPKVQSVAFREAAEHPTTFVVDTRLSASPVSEYAIELLVAENGNYKSRRFNLDKLSRAFVEIRRHEVYGIRLINRSAHDAAVHLTIDGVNVFEFSEQSPRPNYWFVPASHNGKPGTTFIRGWDKSADRSIEFKVVDFPESAAARVNLKPSPSIGLISASFAACWENDSDRPRSEGRTRATGFGEELVDVKRSIQRHVGQVRDVVTIRYERTPPSNDPLAVLLVH